MCLNCAVSQVCPCDPGASLSRSVWEPNSQAFVLNAHTPFVGFNYRYNDYFWKQKPSLNTLNTKLLTISVPLAVLCEQSFYRNTLKSVLQLNEQLKMPYLLLDYHIRAFFGVFITFLIAHHKHNYIDNPQYLIYIEYFVASH